MSREKMVPAAHDFHFCIFPDARRELLYHRVELCRRPEAVEFARHQELRLLAALEIGETTALQITDRKAEAHQFAPARIAAPGPQANPRTKTESGYEQRHAGKFFREKIEHGQHV